LPVDLLGLGENLAHHPLIARVRVHRHERRQLCPSIAITPTVTSPAFLHNDNTEVNNSPSAFSCGQRNSAIVHWSGARLARI
jgi:hypothetical protein